MPCQQFGFSRGPQRKELIRRLQAALDSDDVDERLKQGCQQVISITQQASLAADPENKDHHVEAIVWPIDSTVKFVCTGCRRLCSREWDFKRVACDKVVAWNNKRRGYQQQLKEISNGKPGAMQRAAQRALEALAMEDGALSSS